MISACLLGYNDVAGSPVTWLIKGMGKLGRQLVCGAATLALCGCGAFKTTVDDSAVGEANGADSISDLPEPFIPDPADIRTPGGGPLGTDSAQPDVGSIGADDLVSLFLDTLILDLINPAGPAQSFTFLERLCLAGDEPDFVCRQLYGQ